MPINSDSLFLPSTPPSNGWGRYSSANQPSTGLALELWDSEDGALPPGVEDLDNALLDLIENDFSSPSTYPPFTTSIQNPPAPASRIQQPPQPPAPAPAPGSAPLRGNTSTAPRNHNNPSAVTAACPFNASRPERFESQLTTSTSATTSASAGESQDSLLPFGDLDDIIFHFDDCLYPSPSSFGDNMPPSLRRRSGVATPPVDPVQHRSKRRRTSTNPTPPTLRKAPSSRAFAADIKIDDEDDLFEEKPARGAPGKEPKTDDLTTIDLTQANEVPDDLKKPEEDNRIKISAFQCVICMDNCTTLTVTHCGHMYCAQCLHSSLNVEATRGKCPMCRQKLEMKPRQTYNNKTKGYWPLELKLMTATRKGKRKANSMA